MANESTGAPAQVSGESAVSTAGAGTQGQGTQAEAAQTQTSDQSKAQAAPITNTTADVAVKKPEPKTEQVAAKAKLNVNEMIAKQLAGELGDADVAALEEAGLSKDQVEMLANAHRDVQLKNNNEIYEAVGGKEVYEELKTFALENLSDDEIDVYNEAMRHPNLKIAKMASLGLHAMMMSAKGGGKPRERIGDGGSNTSVDTSAFQSQQDVINAMRDPRYGRDQEYTKTVDNRRAKSAY